jgi:putative ABC transport system permease protein
MCRLSLRNLRLLLRSPSLLQALLHEAMDNMRSGRQRTFLSLLGIIIGTAAVIALLNIGENTSDEAARQFKTMGTDLIVLQNGIGIGLRHKVKPLERQDASDLKQKIPAVAIASPISIYSVKVGRAGRTLDGTSIGATEDLLTVDRLQLERGRFVTELDGYDTIVVVGSSMDKALAGDGKRLEIGDKIRMDNYLYTVIGVLQSVQRNPLLPFDIDNALIVPIKANRRMSMATGSISNILVRVAEGHNPIQTLAEVSNHFREKGKSVEAQGALQLIEGMKKQGQLFTWMLVGVACISLLVGGIGVMNAMLAGIAERKKEIGLRLAIGADRMSVMTMIVCESSLLSVAGGVIGIVLGLIISSLFAAFSGWEYSLSYLSILLGVCMSLATGLFFGIYPALKASELSPIEALRSE